jgi:dGTPase
MKAYPDREPYMRTATGFALDPFKRDLFEIIESCAFRRLQDKTQVVPSPLNQHIRTRNSHTLEVYAVAQYISDALGLNTKLCESIAMGHDIGHPPYGHLGEKILSELGGRPFRHAANGVVVAQSVENKGNGLGLTPETLGGILSHSKSSGRSSINRDPDQPNEYLVVAYADEIAYSCSDLEDAVKYGYVGDVPAFPVLGRLCSEMVYNMTVALINESRERGYVELSEGCVFEDFTRMREFLHEEFYRKIDLSVQEGRLRRICDYLPGSPLLEGVDPVLAISLLTDREVDMLGDVLRAGKLTESEMKSTGLYEFLPFLQGMHIYYTNPGLCQE